ncbi:MAG: HAD family hydrolase [Erysipelotrichaceae bacterium]|nr:HAD family hydrolase [Erysipelotrichaceae bacterium]
MNNGIIFDIDGTLWDATDGVTRAWNMVLNAHGFESVTREFVTSLMGLTRVQITASILPQLPLEEGLKIMSEASANARKFIGKGYFELFENEEAILNVLKEKYDLFILTNAGMQYVDMLYDMTGFRYLFKDQISHGETGLDKTGNMKVLIERHHLDKSFYIGDTEGDNQYSRKAGIPFVFVEFGHGKAIDPQYSIGSYDELPALCERIFGE